MKICILRHTDSKIFGELRVGDMFRMEGISSVYVKSRFEEAIRVSEDTRAGSTVAIAYQFPVFLVKKLTIEE